jgi:hypothetical protein
MGRQLVMMIDAEEVMDEGRDRLGGGDDRLSRPRARQLDLQGVSDPPGRGQGRDPRREGGSLTPPFGY